MRPFLIICVLRNSLPFLAGVPPTLNGNIKIFWRCLCYLTKLCHPNYLSHICGRQALHFVPDVQLVSQWIKSSCILDQTLTHNVFLLSTTPLVSNVVQTTQSALGGKLPAIATCNSDLGSSDQHWQKPLCYRCIVYPSLLNHANMARFVRWFCTVSLCLTLD